MRLLASGALVRVVRRVACPGARELDPFKEGMFSLSRDATAPI